MNQISVTGNRMVKIKKEFIQLFQNLVEQKFIQPELQIIYKNGKQRQIRVEELTVNRITRRIQYVKFNEIIRDIICVM